MGNPNTLKRRNLRVEAGWLFNKGGEQELDASSERSENANEDILIFFFQLDLATRVQVCWQSFCLDFFSHKRVEHFVVSPVFEWFFNAHELLLDKCYKICSVL